MKFIFAVCAVALLAILVFFLVFLVRNGIAELKRDALNEKIEQYVKAAEQQIRGAGRGFEKRDYVEGLLKNDGICITDNVIAMIEATVYKIGG